MDPGTGKKYASMDEAIADGVDPSKVVSITEEFYLSNRSSRRRATARQTRISNQAGRQKSEREANRKAAARRIQKQSRKANRKKK